MSGRFSRRRCGAAVLGSATVALLMASCGSREEVDTSRPADFGFQRSVQTTLEEEGRVAYERYCVGCHGVKGDGLGPAAGFLHPKPRSFVEADFKFSWTRAGQLPTDDDLRRSIKEGLRGSAMPPWDLLPDRTVDALIAYIKTFSTKWSERGPGKPIPRVDDPYGLSEDKSAAIARGEAVYHGFANCWACHPAYVSEEKLNEHLVAFGSPARPGFRPGLEHSVGKANTQGDILYPPDFHRDFVRSGADLDDLYRVIGAGVTGAAMPTWIDSMDIPGEKPGDPPLVQRSDVWAMAYYVQWLIANRPARLDAATLVVRPRAQKIYATGEIPVGAAPDTSDGGDEEFLEEEEFFEEESP